jgi:hypothetical protein
MRSPANATDQRPAASGATVIALVNCFDGKKIKYPSIGHLNVTFKKAPKFKGWSPEQLPF